MRYGTIRCWRVWAGALFCVTVACSFSSDGGASDLATETVLDSMSGANAPEERWGGASCQRKSSASFHWVSVRLGATETRAFSRTPAPTTLRWI